MCPNRLFGGEVDEFDIVRYKLRAGRCGHFVCAAEWGGDEGSNSRRSRRIRVGGGRRRKRRSGSGRRAKRREGIESAGNGIDKNFFEFPTAAALAIRVSHVDDGRANHWLMAEHIDLGRPDIPQSFPAALVGEFAAGLVLGWVLGHASVLKKGHGDIGCDVDRIRCVKITRVPCEENVSGAKVLPHEPFAVLGHLIGVWTRPGV